MFDAVVPAHNEEKSILTVLNTLSRLPLTHIFVVVNGCTDKTLELVQAVRDRRLRIIYFTERLGIDVPRAIGALYAKSLNSQGVLFVDGDLSGNIHANLLDILNALASGIDLALTNCYPHITDRANLARLVLKFRGRLNRELGLFQKLGLATPTHGPHGLSGRALRLLPPTAIAIPPLSLVWAQKKGLTIKVVTSIPHRDLHSPRKHRRHARLIAHTVIGDCLMGICLAKGQPYTRSLGKHHFLGYHPERRFDILEKWEQALMAGDSDLVERHVILPAQV